MKKWDGLRSVPVDGDRLKSVPLFSRSVGYEKTAISAWNSKRPRRQTADRREKFRDLESFRRDEAFVTAPFKPGFEPAFKPRGPPAAWRRAWGERDVGDDPDRGGALRRVHLRAAFADQHPQNRAGRRTAQDETG